MPVGDVAGRQFDRRRNRRGRILDAMVGLETGFQTLEDFNGFGN